MLISDLGQAKFRRSETIIDFYFSSEFGHGRAAKLFKLIFGFDALVIL